MIRNALRTRWSLPAAISIGVNDATTSRAIASGTFAYGTWNGHISFWEPVVNRDWVVSQKPASACQPIPQTPQVELTGYYPETMCTRYGSGVR